MLISSIFSSSEHKVPAIVSVINFLPCVRCRGHIFSPILMKLGQNVCLILKSQTSLKMGFVGHKLGH